MKKINIGWLSAAAYAQTGYGRICKEVVSRLIRDGWNVINIGGIGGTTVWGGKMEYPVWVEDTSNDPIKSNDISKLVHIPIVPTVGQLAGQDVIDVFIDKYKLNLLITHWDCFAIDFATKLDIPCIPYLPIDAPFTEKMYNDVKESYKIIAFSQFGYRELLKWFPPEKIEYIPHGISTAEWSPLSTEERMKARDKYNIPQEEFVICSVAANVGERKQLPFMMLAFKKFLEKHPNSRLNLFTNTNVSYPRGYDLTSFKGSLKIGDKVFSPKYDPIIEPFTNEELREFYGLADVYLTTTLGEGFGIPILEAQACGLPVIAPDNSTMPELVQGHGWIFNTCDDFPFVPVWIPTNQIYPSPSMSSLIDTLEKVYNNPEQRIEYGKQSRVFALQYDWKNIIPQWEELLQKAEHAISMWKF